MPKSQKTDELESTKDFMGALVRMKPKPHEEMKVGKGARKKTRGSSGKKKPSRRAGFLRGCLGLG